MVYVVFIDLDIYFYNIEKGIILNLCKLNGKDLNGIDEMKGYDINFKFSFNGKYIVW